MSAVSEARRRVLFVDDDPRFLEMIEKVMGRFSKGRWQVFTAENAGRALGLVQEHSPHLVVIDVQMPVVDGLQFLTLLNRRYPNLQKVVLTGFATEAYRAACLSNGAELFLEKPGTPAHQESLFATLDEVMRFQPEEGFRGVLRKVGLTEIIQMECLGAGSSILEVKTTRGKGCIYIHEGTILHAEAGELAGEPAFNFILGLRGGEFFVRPFSPPPAQTIQGSWEFLLMEAVRQRDEAASNAEEETTGLAAVQSPTGPAADLSLDAAVASLAELEPATAADLPEPAPVAEPFPDPGTTEAAAVEGAIPGVDWGGLSEAAAAPPRVIEEVFVCSQQGTVLHGWQVRNGDLWINFFEFVSQKSRRLSMGLPLGVFERLEVGDGVTRLSILIDDDRGVLVRSREEGAKSDPAGNVGSAVSQQRFAEWLDAGELPAGFLAVALRFPDQTVRVRVAQDALAAEPLDNASRCAADVFRVLKVHRLPSLRLRWTYQGGVLDCARRPDDILLAVLTDGVQDAGPLLAEFSGLDAG